MVSERRRLANQRNALLSTGPRTTAGKERSRRNALKHGLAGMGSILPPEDERLFQERMQAWTAEKMPNGELPTYLLAGAVLASVRVDRCARHEFAAIARKRREAVRNWQRRQDRKIARLAELLKSDPAAALEKLTAFASGCGWLVEQWEQLDQALETAGHWTDEQLHTALRLLGHDPAAEGDPGADGELAAWRLHARALRPGAGGDEPARRAAREALQERIDAELDRLEATRHELWYEDEGPALGEAINLATIDTSHQGALRHRYAVAADLAMHRSLNQLARHEARDDRKRRQDDRDATPTDSPRAGAADLNNDLCAWLRQGGQKTAGRPAAPAPEPEPQPRPEPEPQPAAPAADRIEATESASTSDAAATCDGKARVANPAPAAAQAAPEPLPAAARRRPQEVDRPAEPCAAP